MIQRDFFKRHIEILAQAVGTLLGLKEKGEIQGSLAGVEEAVQKAFGMSWKLALGMPFRAFVNLTCRGEEPSPALLAAAAELFEQWAGLLKAEGRVAEAEQALARAQEIVLLLKK